MTELEKIEMENYISACRIIYPYEYRKMTKYVRITAFPEELNVCIHQFRNIADLTLDASMQERCKILLGFYQSDSKDADLDSCATSSQWPIPESLFHDQQVMLYFFYHKSKEFKSFPFVHDNKQVVSLVARLDPFQFQFSSPILKSDTKFMRMILENQTICPDMLEYLVRYAPLALRDDSMLMKSVVKESIRTLRYASERLKDNLDFMKTILILFQGEIEKDKHVLPLNYSNVIWDIMYHASRRLKGDASFMTLALEQTSLAIESVRYNLIDDDSFMLNAISLDANHLPRGSKRFLSSYLKDDSKAAIAIQNHPRLIAYTTSQFQLNNQNYARKVLSQGGMFLSQLCLEMRDTKEIVEIAIHHTLSAFKYASDRLKDDESLVDYIIWKDYKLLNLASARLQEKLRWSSKPRNCKRQKYT